MVLWRLWWEKWRRETWEGQTQSCCKDFYCNHQSSDNSWELVLMCCAHLMLGRALTSLL